MNVIDIRGFTEDAIVGPQNGATRVFIWCTTVQAGHVVGLHKHLGEELSRVLSMDGFASASATRSRKSGLEKW